MSVEFRCYYDSRGVPHHYSMIPVECDLPYILVESMDYHRRSPSARVIDGVLRYPYHSAVLRESSVGKACDPDDVTLVVDQTQPNKLWSKITVYK